MMRIRANDVLHRDRVAVKERWTIGERELRPEWREIGARNFRSLRWDEQEMLLMYTVVYAAAVRP